MVNIISTLWTTTLLLVYGCHVGQPWLASFVEVVPFVIWRTSTRTEDFSQGRKLKCDGSRPSCGNCNRRGYPCVYAPVCVLYLVQDRTTLTNAFPVDRNSKNRDFSSCWLCFVRIACIFLRGSWNLLPANPASAFVHGRDPEGERLHEWILTWTDSHRLHLNNMHAYSFYISSKHFVCLKWF